MLFFKIMTQNYSFFMRKTEKSPFSSKKYPQTFVSLPKSTTFALANEKQPRSKHNMVPWMSGLVTGLQNRLHPFESGRHLQKKAVSFLAAFSFFIINRCMWHLLQ